MDKEVIEFLKSTKISYKEFDRLLTFYELKDELIYKQNFTEVCSSISNFLKENLHAKSVKITSYDIEYAKEKMLFLDGENFNQLRTKNLIDFDFSKSYSLNGRLFFEIDSDENYEALKKDEKFLAYMFFELKSILSTYLALEQIQGSCFTDEATGMQNRRFLLNHLTTLLPVIKKENMKLALLKVEVDRLKAVVEEFNFEVAQQVLKKLANVLKKYVVDTNLVTKFEGDTFLILMQDIDNDEEVSSLAQKIINDFANQSVIVNFKTGQKLQKTICIGVVKFPDDGDGISRLFTNVDIALDEAKNKGRSSYEFYKEEQNSAIDFF